MKLYIYIRDYEAVSKGDFEFSLDITSRGDLQESQYFNDWFLVGEFDIDLDFDAAVMAKAAVEQIEKEREAIKAELSQKMQKLDDRKASLLVIEHKAA